MKKKIFNLLYKKSLKVIAINIVKYETLLTKEYLIKRGWICIDGMYYEPNVKDRDIIYIRFSGSNYMVFHSSKQTYIATERSVEWFENYYLLMHPDNGRYELAGV